MTKVSTQCAIRTVTVLDSWLPNTCTIKNAKQQQKSLLKGNQREIKLLYANVKQ